MNEKSVGQTASGVEQDEPGGSNKIVSLLVDLSWRQYDGRKWHCPAQPGELSVCQFVPGPRLELLGCCMLRQFGCGSNPGDQTVGARGTRGGLASPDWLEQETSEETSSPAVLWPSEDTRTCIHTANKPNADGSRWLLREEQGASKGRGPYQDSLSMLITKKETQV